MTVKPPTLFLYRRTDVRLRGTVSLVRHLDINDIQQTLRFCVFTLGAVRKILVMRYRAYKAPQADFKCERTAGSKPRTNGKSKARVYWYI